MTSPKTFSRVLPLIAALLLLLTLVPATAATAASGRSFYVATNGDDAASGSEAHPWHSIYYAMEQLHAGDTLYVRGGTYSERIGTLRPLPEGTPDNRITVRNYPGEHPVIRGYLNVFKGGFRYWTVDGLEIVWDPSTGAPNEALVRLVDGVGWELRNMTIHGNESYAAVRIMAETPGLATDWAIRDSCIHTTIPANGPNNDHNIYVGADSRFGVAPGPGVIERNVIYGAPNGANIKLAAGEPTLPGTHDVIVRDNVMGGAPQNVLIAWKSHENVVTDNVMIREDNGTWSQPWYPNVRGFDLTGTSNVAYSNGGYGSDAVVDSHHSPVPVGDGGNARLTRLATSRITDPCTQLQDLGGQARAFGPDSVVHRKAGTSRVSTASTLSTAAFPDGANTVVLARADDYADALAGAPLAGHLDAPLLLTDRRSLSDETAATIRTLGASTAYLLGGTGAISKTVEDDLRALGLATHRVSGASRFATAAAVADLLPPSDDVFLVEGANPDPNRGWPDAVALSPLAARTAKPVLLTTANVLPDETATALAELHPSSVTIVGGTGAVSKSVAAAAGRAAAGGHASAQIKRVAGADRFSTSAAVALETVKSGGDASDVWLTTGMGWPDALAAGPVVAKRGGTMLFVHPDDARNSPPVLDWLADRTDPDALTVTVVGGPGAVSYRASSTLAYGLG